MESNEQNSSEDQEMDKKGNLILDRESIRKGNNAIKEKKKKGFC